MEIDYDILKNKNIADILVVTATDVETMALHRRMEGVCSDGILTIKSPNNTYYAGILGEYQIIHCQCGSMGTQDTNSSILTTQTALQEWQCVKAVVMVGIAFGMYDDDEKDPQYYSDVLVASSVFPYENQRLNSDDTVDHRGKPFFASNALLSAFKGIQKEWSWTNLLNQRCKIRIVPILSGEKLVDNLDYRNKLRTALPGYRGGEMEGVGVAAVCERLTIPWTLAKAICDFGDGNKGKGKKEKQENAAAAAVDCCVNMFKEQNLSKIIGRKTNFYYREEIIKGEDIFFIHYEEANEPYYLKRKIDEEVMPFIRSKNCWVFGKSGIGKSTLLFRSMNREGIQNIYVDCGVSSKEDEMAVFVNIVEDLCDLNNEECTVDVSMPLRTIIKNLSLLLDKHYPKTKIYILIDEIPVDSDSDVFKKFASNLCQAIGYIGRQVKSATVFFMLSSIFSPLKAFNSIPEIQKYRQHIKFVELDEWTEEECLDLVDLLSKHAQIEWNGDISKEEFIKLKDYSPREIKNTL